MLKEIIHNYYNKPKDKPRELGHYYASELWAIYKGYTTTGNFFKQKEIDKMGQAMIFRGSAMEDMLTKVFTEEKVDFKQQTRLEIKVNEDITISGKLDFEFPDYVLETKCPDQTTNGIPDKWKFQLEMYHRMTGKPVYLGIFDKQGIEIIRFFKYVPSDKVWSTIQECIINFHNKLLKKCSK